MTAHRALNENRNTGRRVLAEFDAALTAEERAVFDWLVSLHPDWAASIAPAVDAADASLSDATPGGASAPPG